MWTPTVLTEFAVRGENGAAPDLRASYAEALSTERAEDRADLAIKRESLPAAVSDRLVKRWDQPFTTLFYMLGETLSYQLLGMALYRSGFFSGAWAVRRLAMVTAAGLGLGGGATIVFAHWALAAGFPEMTMRYAIGYGLGFAHLAMALGYAAGVMILAAGAAPARSAQWLGGSLRAAGRMAFSNYLGTSLVMTALFDGWGLGLAGRWAVAGLWTFVLAGWLAMLCLSRWWLARWRQGPLEWAWRSLTEWRLLPMRRIRDGADAL
jgi:uncharacterized protein